MMTEDIIDEFIDIINGITATFVDARNGFELLQQHLKDKANQHGPDKKVYYGDGPPGSAKIIAVSTTLGERISKNECDAENYTFIGNMALVAIYSYWDDYYRKEIAQSLGVKKEDLKSNIFGEIRFLRRSIIHHRAIALPDISKCQILIWFKPNDDIFLSEEMFLQMVGSIFEDLNRIKLLKDQT